MGDTRISIPFGGDLSALANAAANGAAAGVAGANSVGNAGGQKSSWNFSGVQQEPQGRAVIDIGNAEYDITPIVQAFDDLSVGATLAARNPMDPRALRAIQAANAKIQLVQRTQLPRQIIQLIGPFVRELVRVQSAVSQAHKMRVEVGNALMRQPTVPIPINLALSNVVPDTTDIEIKNPYLGSGGNNAGAIWAITAFEAGSGENISGNALITKLSIAGHDYVPAGLAGITSWPSNVGRMTATRLGIPLWHFANNKFHRHETSWRPWNLGDAAGIVGSIMRETGSVIMRFGWNGGVGTSFNDSLNVLVRATMCGLPFKATDLRDVYLPLAEQAQGAMTLAQYLPITVNKAMAPQGGNVLSNAMNNTIRGVEELTQIAPEDMIFMVPDYN
jgi:hypothetical protein